MANRYMYQFTYSFEQKPVHIYAKITFGAAGAPTLVAANSKGVKSIVRNSAGDYTLTLQDNYKALLSFRSSYLTATAPAAPGVYVKVDTVSSSTAPAVEFITNTTGTATDPGSGEALILEMVLRNSQV